MQANDSIAGGELQTRKTHEQIAAWWHFAGFLAIMAGICGMGFLAQHAGGGNAGSTDSGLLDRV